MNPNREIEFLRAQIGTLNDLLAMIPSHLVLTRGPMEEQKAAAEARIKQLESAVGRYASVVLQFFGRPVLGSIGIDADFASRALSSYQDFVTADFASEKIGALSERGTFPERDFSRLHITALTHGSVGFALEELSEQISLTSTPLHEATVRTGKLIQAAVSNDDTYEELAAELDDRVRQKATDFFGVLKGAGASLKMVVGDSSFQVNEDQVAFAHARTSSTRIEHADERLRGVFRGLVLDSRSFEFRTDEDFPIRGKLAADVNDETALRMVALTAKRCDAFFRISTATSQSSRQRKAYKLVSLIEFQEQPAPK